MKAFSIKTDVKIVGIQCGEEACAPSHSFGPYIRDHWLVHYVRAGCGVFRVHGRNYTVNAGEVFFIPPNISTYYIADKDDPWEYVWFGIHGEGLSPAFAAAGLTDRTPVRAIPKAAVQVMERVIEQADTLTAFQAVAAAYTFLDVLTAGSSFARGTGEGAYVERAEEYLRQSLYKKTTVEEVAAHLNINRSYLTALFKKYHGVSTQQWMLQIKMETACRYLATTDYDVARIARSVGYEDMFVFSHAFRNMYGESPTSYRKRTKKV